MVLGHKRHSVGSSRSSQDESRGAQDVGEDETIVDDQQGNVLTHIISQLRPGADLSRVTLPTFILEPRTMLERITNFMAHPEIMLQLPGIDDPIQRFVSVVKFYLSGWHIKPPGVKKPLNPILGETFTCYWEYPDKTKGYYISEQTSHHPPKSSYFFLAPEHNIRIDGTLKPRSRFLGNSAASLMEGIAVMRFLNRGERFFITQPNMYARGILFGKMKYELGDHSTVKCPESGLVADIEFKTKGYFSGTYNAIGGFIKDTKNDRNLFELSGLWNEEMYIKDLSTGKKTLLFDASHARETYPTTRPLEQQGERESQKLWKKVTDAIKVKDQDTATDEKSRIEDMQRQEAATRAQDGEEWKPSLFRSTHEGQGGLAPDEESLDWIIDANIDGSTSEEQIKQVLAIAPILPGQESDSHESSIPSRSTGSKGAYAMPPQGNGQQPQQENAPVTPQPPTHSRTLPNMEQLSMDDTHQSHKKPDRGENALSGARPGSERLPSAWKIQEPGKPEHESTLQQSRSAPQHLRRADSETGQDDDFVDAEG